MVLNKPNRLSLLLLLLPSSRSYKIILILKTSQFQRSFLNSPSSLTFSIPSDATTEPCIDSRKVSRLSFNMQSKWSALVALALFTSSNAHSWVEMMNVIAPNGTYNGAPGFARGNCQRAAGVDPDKCMVQLLPPNGRVEGNKILDSDAMCKDTQQSPTQSKDSPRLQAAPGSLVALRYQENGHVTLPDTQKGKPANRGTVYIYGTTEPDPNEKFLAVHNVWNADGTGGNKKGKLLAMQNFDDGQCYQINGQALSAQRQKQFPHEAAQPMGQDLWCQNNFALPSDAPSGKPYTLYWVWDWPTLPGTDGFPNGKAEIYTTVSIIPL